MLPVSAKTIKNIWWLQWDQGLRSLGTPPFHRSDFPVLWHHLCLICQHVAALSWLPQHKLTYSSMFFCLQNGKSWHMETLNILCLWKIWSWSQCFYIDETCLLQIFLPPNPYANETTANKHTKNIQLKKSSKTGKRVQQTQYVAIPPVAKLHLKPRRRHPTGVT